MSGIAKTLWIGPDDTLALGQVGFLVKKSHATKGWERYEVRGTPAHTNQSHRPRLHGWCGTDNDIATHGNGMVKVVRMARNGRALVEQLNGAALNAALEELGYPELAE